MKDGKKHWGIEDVHGHRYMAQLSDGKDRWLLPLPRKDWEQLWAAVCKAHPDMADAYGGGQNFLRQYVGKMMTYLLELEEWDDPYVSALALENEVQQWEQRAERIQLTITKVGDTSLPKAIRMAAVKILLRMDDDEVLAVNPEITTERLIEWAHLIEMGE